MSLIGLLIFILIVALILGLVEYVLRTAPLPGPWATFLRLAVAVIAIIVLISMLTGNLGTQVIRIN